MWRITGLPPSSRAWPQAALAREYHAFVWGAPSARRPVQAAIGRNPTHRERWPWFAGPRAAGRITHWSRPRPPRPGRLLVCRLETGRTHQIRVHMAHIGHPLLGDAIYGAGFKTKTALLSPAARAAVEALGRQALHAATLGFTHPVTREELMFESELPADLATLRQALAEV